jgi:hypothetical protein
MLLLLLALTTTQCRCSLIALWFSCRVELVSLFFARLVNRRHDLHLVIAKLQRETQVLICQRLGYTNVFTRSAPAGYYRLRMWRLDEYRIAHTLYRIASRSEGQCFRYFAIDSEEKKVMQGPGAFCVCPGLGNLSRVLWSTSIWGQETKGLCCRHVEHNAQLCSGRGNAKMHIGHSV